MRVLLVARGSQGDVYPFLAIAKALKDAGHCVHVHLPVTFEKFVKELNVEYSVQDDDIESRADIEHIKMTDMLSWMAETIVSQFDELLPLIENCDLCIVSNTEFAATTLAEYTKKPLLRTAYAPIIPGKKMMPPLTPLTKSALFLRPSFLWHLIDIGTNMIATKPINKWRITHGLCALKNYSRYSYSYTKNLLLYSPILGSVDNSWKYPWHITGYCFHDRLSYEKETHARFLEFIHKDARPALFFTTGSIKGDAQNDFAQALYTICCKRGYKFVIGSGWGNIGAQLRAGDDVFVLDSVVPHALVFEHCAALIHHGGSGTTHSASRSGKPQLVVPLIIDQFYWRERVVSLGLGPGGVSLKKTRGAKLENAVVDVMTNPAYAKNAATLGEKLRSEDGVQLTVQYMAEYAKRGS
ncbi:MAG: glycosyltransferase [Treponemataceae bacterium]|nr:MAG: glycosyltransferase [Treponemataceae bacterium]